MDQLKVHNEIDQVLEAGPNREYQKIEHNNITYHFEDNALQSVYPPESHFGFTYWALMIPPFDPKRTLMLGCGDHTISKLIEKIWGFCIIDCNEYRDAFEYAHDLSKQGYWYDYIIVDLFEGAKVPDRVFFDDIFIQKLAEISRGLIAVNADREFYESTEYAKWFDKILIKKLNKNIVTFMARHGFQKQYFAPKL